MSELVKVVPLGNRNLMGLRPAQASLYKYMKKCAEDQTIVQIDEVIRIYFNEVRNPMGEMCARCGPTYRHILNKNAAEYMKTNYPGGYSYHITAPAKMWMQHTVGSLVMRGLLTVIPNFDIKISEE